MPIGDCLMWDPITQRRVCRDCYASAHRFCPGGKCDCLHRLEHPVAEIETKPNPSAGFTGNLFGN